MTIQTGKAAGGCPVKCIMNNSLITHPNKCYEYSRYRKCIPMNALFLPSLVPRLLPVFQCYTQKNGGAWYLIARDLCVQERPNSLAFSKRGDRHS